MSKLYRARSLLYRRQILQVNFRWKALDEIYKMYIFLHRSDLKFLAKKVVTILAFLNVLASKNDVLLVIFTTTITMLRLLAQHLVHHP